MQNERYHEISDGRRKTTNNRMELMGVTEGLKTLSSPCTVIVQTDSMYVVQGIEKEWAKKWKANGWMRNKTQKAINQDLWKTLLDLCEFHEVKFVWVPGHSGDPDK